MLVAGSQIVGGIGTGLKLEEVWSNEVEILESAAEQVVVVARSGGELSEIKKATCRYIFIINKRVA